MSKKDRNRNNNVNKPQVINNIEQLNLEIDYDKLAEAIIKAQEISEDKENTKHKFTSGSFMMFVIGAFRAFAIILGILAAIMFLTPFIAWNSLQWSSFTNVFNSIFTIIFCIVIAIVLALYTALLWKSAKEIETEKDRNYIISVFSGIVSFAALIVALVALFKGVG